MQAPDKIFVSEAMETEKGLFGLWTDKDHRDTPYVEYIRKDAILEWAKGQKKETEDLIKEHPKDDSLWAEMHWYEQLIKHIESL